MRSAGIIKAEVTADCDTGLGDTVVGLQINLLCFDGPPKALDKNFIPPRSFAVHADGDARFEKNVGEAGAGELAALIGIENVRSAVASQCLDAELRFHK